MGLLIFIAVSKDSRLLESSCRHGRANIKFISNVNANNIATEIVDDGVNGIAKDMPDVTKDDNTNNVIGDFKNIENRDFDTNFVLQHILLTTESCQLQYFTEQSLKPFLQPLVVYNLIGDLEVTLEISIINKEELEEVIGDIISLLAHNRPKNFPSIFNLIKEKLLDLIERTFYKRKVSYTLLVMIRKRFSLRQTIIEDITFGLVRMYVTPYRFSWTIFMLGLALSYTDKLLVFRWVQIVFLL